MPSSPDLEFLSYTHWSEDENAWFLSRKLGAHYMQGQQSSMLVFVFESCFSPKPCFLVFLITQLSDLHGIEKVLEYFDLSALFNSSLHLKSYVAMEMQHTRKGQNMFPDSVVEAW